MNSMRVSSVRYVLLVCSIFLTCTNAACPPGTIEDSANNVCYKFESDKKTFYDAEQKCIEYGGHLSSISNAFQNSMITNSANRAGVTNFFNGANALHSADWSWIDNAIFQYTNWFNGISSGLSACVTMDSNGYWHISDCSIASSFVCSIQNSTTSDATSSTSAATTPNPTTEMGECDDGFTFFNSSCFKAVYPGTYYYYTDAQDYCRTIFSAPMTSIHSQEENDLVIALSLAAKPDVDYVWIGIQRDNDNATYHWADGTGMDYTNWWPGQPYMNTYHELHAYITLSSRDPSDQYGQWNQASENNVCYVVVCRKATLS